MPVPSSFADLDTVANNNSPQGTETAKGNVDDYFRAHAALIKQNYNLALGVATAPRVMGLTGKTNSSSPLTKYDLAVNAVVLRDSTGATVARYNGSATCDLGLAGPAANGRDQAAAFSANSWVYLYFIWNGTTLATIASTSSTAPTLPSGYTHYAFATTLRWNASSNIVACVTQGSAVFYDTVSSLIAAGQATTLTTLTASSSVPPNALRAILRTGLAITSHSSTIQLDMLLRRTGATGTGNIVHTVATQSYLTVSGYPISELALNASQQIDYRITTVPSGGGGAYIDVYGYRVPNGGE